MARRNVLNGASPWEREERANQQRDYAAQLQEQVKQKQLKQEQEKQQKLQEQRQELELMEQERSAPARKPQRQEQPAEVPPPVSPQRTVSMPQLPASGPQWPEVLPTNANTFAGGTNHRTESQLPEATSIHSSMHGEAGSYAPAFTAAPSIFESLLREPGFGARSTKFYDDLAALHKLSAELDVAAKLRRSKSNYVKPNFILQQGATPSVPSADSVCASLNLREEELAVHRPKKAKAVDPATNYRREKTNQMDEQHEFHSNHQLMDGGLQEESVLVPYTPLPPQHPSKANVMSRADLSPVTNVGALQNDSEMLQFSHG